MSDDPLDEWVHPAQPAVAASQVYAPPAADPLDEWVKPAQTFNAPDRPMTLDNGPNGPILRPLSDQEAANRAAQLQQPAPVTHPESLSDWLDVAKQSGQYAWDQVKGIPSAIADQYRAGTGVMNSGLADLRTGNYAPSFPSSDPSTWGAGGIVKSAAGALGAAASPLNGISQKAVVEPFAEATGNRNAAEVLGAGATGLGANFLAGKLAGGVADPETLRLAQWADQNGLPVRAAQISNSPLVKKLDQAVGWIPGSGRTAEDAAQAGAVNRIAAKSFGEDTDQITRATIGNARDRIGGVLNDVEARTPIQMDAPTTQSLVDVLKSAGNMFGQGTDRYNVIKNQVGQIVDLAKQHGGTVPGDAWAALYHKGSPIDRLASGADTDIGGLASDLKTAAQNAVQRQATPEDAAAYTQARSQYKNMKTIEPLVVSGEPGDVSPLGLARKVATRYDVANPGPLGNLADASQRFLRKPQDSGTPLGEYALKALTTPGAAIGAGMAGSQLMGMSIPEALGLGVAAPAMNAGVARLANGLLNNPIYRKSLLRGGDTSSLANELIYGALPNTTAGQKQNPPQLER